MVAVVGRVFSVQIQIRTAPATNYEPYLLVRDTPITHITHIWACRTLAHTSTPLAHKLTPTHTHTHTQIKETPGAVILLARQNSARCPDSGALTGERNATPQTPENRAFQAPKAVCERTKPPLT